MTLMESRNQLLDQKIADIFAKRDVFFKKVGGKSNDELLKNPELALRFGLVVYNHMRNLGVTLKDVSDYPEFKSGKLLVAKTILGAYFSKIAEDIFNKRNAIYDTMGGTSSDDYQAELQRNEEFRLKYALAVYAVAKEQGLGVQDLLDTKYFESGKLLAAKQILISHFNKKALFIFKERDEFWRIANELSKGDNDKTVIIFMLLIKQAISANGFTMRDFITHECFQSGRLLSAMKLYSAVNGAKFIPKIPHAEPKPPTLPKGEPGLFTQAGIQDRDNVANVRRQAKQAALFHHPDKANPDRNPEILDAAIKILNLNKEGHLTTYFNNFYGDQSKPNPGLKK